MKKLIAFSLLGLVILFIGAGSEIAEAAIAFVQATSTYVAASGNTISKAFVSNVTAGNLIVAAVNHEGTATIQVGDNRGDTFTAATALQTATGFTGRMQIFYAENVAGGATTVNATTSAAVAGRILAIHEFSGLATSAALDATSTNTGTSANPISSGTSTTSVANEVILGSTFDFGDVTAVGSGFTSSTQPVSAAWSLTEYRIVSASGSYSASFTVNGPANGWAAQMATFKQATAAVSNPPTGTMLVNEDTVINGNVQIK